MFPRSSANFILLKFPVLVILLIHHVSSQEGPEVDFCDERFSCPTFNPAVRATHTFCLLNFNCRPGRTCTDYRNNFLTMEEKKALLDRHNELRSQTALGKGPKSIDNEDIPPAALMNELVWDEELELSAQCWANQCGDDHDKCRTKADGTSVGQNLAWDGNPTCEVNFTVCILDMLQRFYDESKNVTVDFLQNHTQSYGYKVGHYTMMVNGNSKQLGCGRSRFFFAEFGVLTTYLVCHYAPSGNYLNLPTYIAGEPCSKCLPHTKCSKDVGLCSTEPSNTKMPNLCKFAKIPNCKPILENPGIKKNIQPEKGSSTSQEEWNTQSIKDIPEVTDNKLEEETSTESINHDHETKTEESSIEVQEEATTKEFKVNSKPPSHVPDDSNSNAPSNGSSKNGSCANLVIEEKIIVKTSAGFTEKLETFFLISELVYVILLL